MSSNETPPATADVRIRDLVEAIGSDCISPGCGAAASLTLALAAACGAKAVAVSLKHVTEDKDLQEALGYFRGIARRALDGADRDSEAFARFLQEQTEEASEELVDVVEDVDALAVHLLTQLDKIAPRIDSRVMGDMIAARTLAHAARTIERRNVTETRLAQEQT